MAENKKKYIVLMAGQIDLCVGDLVELLSGGPTMTIIGYDDSALKCAWFEKAEDMYGELGVVLLPRAALRLVDSKD